MKSYTDLEQSKRLAEILPHNTADNTWERVTIAGSYFNIPEEQQYVHNGNMPFTFFSGIGIPCWSLAALLGLMPKLYEFENDPDDGGCQPNLCKGWDNNQWHIVYRSSIYITGWYDEAIDSAVEMICWLKENGKI